MTSVNTNVAAITALRTLQQTNNQLDQTQSRISTGLKIGEAKDNAAYWAISTTLKSDNKSLATVKDALGLGSATVDVAYQGLTKAKDVLDEIKAKLTAATQDGVDRTTIQAEISELQKQLVSIASSSVFAGENWLSVDTSSAAYQSTKGIVSGSSRDMNGNVAVSTVNVQLNGLALFDSNPNSKGIVNSAVTLKKADGTELTVGGTNASGAAPSTAGLTGATTEVKGAAVAAASGAKATLGYFTTSGLDVNDKLKFDMTLNGGTTATVTVDLTNVSSAATFKTALEGGLNAAGFGAAGVNVDVAIDATTGAISFASKLTGASAGVTVANVVAQDGDGAIVAGSKSGMTALAGVKTGTDTAAAYTFANVYSGTNQEAGAILTFSAELSGTTKTFDVTTTNATATIDQYIVDMQRDVNSAFGNNKIVVGKDVAGTRITLTSVDKGEAQSIIVNSVAVKFDPATAGTVDTSGFTNGAARASGTSTQAFFDAGTYSASIAGAQRQDRLQFEVQTAGQSWKTVSVDLSKLDYTSQSTYMAGLQASVDAAVGLGVVQVMNGAGASTGGVASGNIAFASTAKGAAASVQLRNVQVLDGNGTTTSKLGLTTGTAAGTAAVVAPTAASVLTGSAFTAPVTFDSQDSMTFKLTVNGGAAKAVTVNKATVEAALAGSVGYVADSGTVSTAADFAKVLKSALDKAGVTGIDVSALSIAPDANKIKFESQTTGPATISTISLDVASVVSTTGGDTISVDKINIGDAAMTALGVDGTNRKDVLSAYISVVNTAINNVTTAASNLGAVASRIDMQKSFVNTLMDTIDKGVGGLIDADMSEESTKLQALQVKQSLGVQALSIANQSSQNILRLFQ